MTTDTIEFKNYTITVEPHNLAFDSFLLTINIKKHDQSQLTGLLNAPFILSHKFKCWYEDQTGELTV